MTMRTLLICALLISGVGCVTNNRATGIPSWEPTRDDGSPIPDPKGMEDVPSTPTRPI